MIIYQETDMDKISISLPPVLGAQIEEILKRDQLGSKSGFLAELIRLGLERYCEGSNKILVNLKMGRD
jgi:metal-responsive CopG/Arc/MetJ family transcriptional regulator